MGSRRVPILEEKEEEEGEEEEEKGGEGGGGGGEDQQAGDPLAVRRGQRHDELYLHG